MRNYIIMANSTHLQLLREKIGEVRSALFYSQNNDIIKLPTCIITALKVDNDGHIWFFMNRPLQYLEDCEKEFPARLNFFRKDKDYSIEVSDKASIINNEEEVNTLVDLPEGITEKAMHKLILVKIKIMNAQYFERQPEKQDYSLRYLTKKLCKWFFINQHGDKPYTTGADHMRIA